VRLRVALKNRGVMPTDSAMAVQRNEDTPVRVTVEGGALVSAALADETFTNVRLQKGRHAELRIPRIRSEEIEYAEVIVRAKAGVELKLTASHPRAVKAAISVKVP
jgi:hypothetical protein